MLGEVFVFLVALGCVFGVIGFVGAVVACIRDVAAFLHPFWFRYKLRRQLRRRMQKLCR